MQQPAYYGPSSGADVVLDAYWVTDELDQADLSNMLMLSISRCSKLTGIKMDSCSGHGS